VIAETKIRQGGVTAMAINHQQNAASGRFYLSSDGTTIRFIHYYCSLNNNDSTTELY